MTTKSIFKIHPFFYFFTLISLITGNFKNYTCFISIIIIHEIGHLLIAIILKWKVEKVLILPFGGITIFNEDINKPLLEEFLILLLGPIFQIIYTILMNNQLITEYSKNLLFFNLLPIIPLDGSKLLNILLNKIVSFKISHLITIYISIMTIIILTIKINSLLIILVFSFIIFKIIEEIKNHENIFNKFLLERYINNYKFKKIKIIKSINLKKMKREHRHIFLTNKKYKTEREILKKRFDFTTKTW